MFDFYQKAPFYMLTHTIVGVESTLERSSDVIMVNFSQQSTQNIC